MVDESTKTKIIEAAGPIFAEVGFERATVRDICSACNVNLASINYYFGDKRQLYLETVKFARMSRAQRYPFADWTAESRPEEKLYDFISTLLRRIVPMQSAPWQVRLLTREIINPTEACRDLVQDYFKPIFESLLGIIDELATYPLEPDQRTKIGFSIIGQCLHYRYSDRVISMMVPEDQRTTHFSVEQLADHITRFCLRGIQSYGSSDESVPRIDVSDVTEHPSENHNQI